MWWYIIFVGLFEGLFAYLSVTTSRLFLLPTFVCILLMVLIVAYDEAGGNKDE